MGETGADTCVHSIDPPSVEAASLDTGLELCSGVRNTTTPDSERSSSEVTSEVTES